MNSTTIERIYQCSETAKDTATIGGMRTAYDERSVFVEKLQELFAKIDDLNRPMPMMEFADLIKDLNQFANLFKNDPIYIRLVASAMRGERKEQKSVVAKAEDNTFKFCEKCDTHIKKKGWAKHRRSKRCLQIFNSKKLAVNITNMEKEKVGRFAKTPIHAFYLIGQSLVSQFSKQKERNAEQMNAEWDAVRLPEQTQQQEDEVGTDESFYEPQEDFSNVVANAHVQTLSLIDPETEVVEVEPEVQKRYVAEGIMSKRFYNQFIRGNMTAKDQSLMDAVYGDYEEDEMGVEYRVVLWGNPTDYITEYSELWFLDCEPEEGYYYPVIVREINTTSPYAMSRCGMDRDPQEDDEESLMKTDEEILALVKPHNHDKILQILQSKRNDFY